MRTILRDERSTKNNTTIMGINTPKLILMIIFFNIINGIAVDAISLTTYTGNTIEQDNIEQVLEQLDTIGEKYSERETFTNIQNTGVITGTAPSDPVSMGLKIAELMWKGFIPVMANQRLVSNAGEQAIILTIQIMQGAMYALIVLTMYQLFHNRKTD